VFALEYAKIKRSHFYFFFDQLNQKDERMSASLIYRNEKGNSLHWDYAINKEGCFSGSKSAMKSLEKINLGDTFTKDFKDILQFLTYLPESITITFVDEKQDEKVKNIYYYKMHIKEIDAYIEGRYVVNPHELPEEKRYHNYILSYKGIQITGSDLSVMNKVYEVIKTQSKYRLRFLSENSFYR